MARRPWTALPGRSRRLHDFDRTTCTAIRIGTSLEGSGVAVLRPRLPEGIQIVTGLAIPIAGEIASDRRGCRGHRAGHAHAEGRYGADGDDGSLDLQGGLPVRSVMWALREQPPLVLGTTRPRYWEPATGGHAPIGSSSRRMGLSVTTPDRQRRCFSIWVRLLPLPRDSSPFAARRGDCGGPMRGSSWRARSWWPRRGTITEPHREGTSPGCVTSASRTCVWEPPRPNWV